MEVSEGQILNGRYKFIKVIGDGAFAEVCLC